MIQVLPLLAASLLAGSPAVRYDVVVVGDTPCGIAAALAAARFDRDVALIGLDNHAGGMMSSGLSITDVRLPNAHGGIFREFTGRVLAWYTDRYGPESEQVYDCNHGLWFEPHVAERIFEAMLAEQPRVTLYRSFRLLQPIKEGSRVAGVAIEAKQSGRRETLLAAVVIDATYEGDLAAAAKVPYRVGREAREEYWEPYAGRVFLGNPGLKLFPGSTGQGDHRVQAYNYRLCMTNRPDIRVAITKPDGYDREEFAPLVELARRGDIRGINDVIRLAPLPNGKFGANNRPIIRSLDLPEACNEWPEATEQRRTEIVARYRQYTLGLLWFLQHDPELPQVLRDDARQWGLCADEFADNGHLPYQIYVREARRIVGRKTFSAHDALLAPGGLRTPLHEDSIATADYHVDSHLVQWQAPGWPQHEGHVYLRAISKPAQVPYGIIVPVEVEGLLVPGAVSATHLGFGVLRMEPVWMALGQAAGTAAHLAIVAGTEPSAVCAARLQQSLIDQGQVITYFFDVPGPDPIWRSINLPQERTRLDLLPSIPDARVSPGIQFFGARGYLESYFARPLDPVTRSEAARWIAHYRTPRVHPSPADSAAVFPDVPSGHPDADVVAALHRAGIVEAWADSRGFFPAAPLSRAEAATWIDRAVGKLPEPGHTDRGASPWKDLAPDDPGFGFLVALDQAGRLPPSWGADGEIDARAAVTREEFLDMLYAAHRWKTIESPAHAASGR